MTDHDDGILRLEVPLPFRPASVNAFLVELPEGGLMLVDGGIDTEEAWMTLDAGVGSAGGWDAVRLHVVTHMHLDHIGLARRVRERAGVPLVMGELDAARSAHAAANADEEERFRADQLRTHGAEAGEIEAIESLLGRHRGLAPPVPVDVALPLGEVAVPGAPGWTAIWTPGHTAGHLSLFRSSDRVLIAGDAVIPRVSPTIGVNRQRSDPVGDYLDTLERIESLRPRRIYGGHGPPLEGTGRVAELRAELLDEIGRVKALLGEEARSAWEIAARRYAGRELPIGPRLQAFRETLAHLSRLEAAGMADRVESDGSVRFRLADARGVPAPPLEAAPEVRSWRGDC